MGTKVKENVYEILEVLPPEVKLVAAAKGQSTLNVVRSVKAGIKIIGENYIKDAKKVYSQIQGRAQLHFIGIPDKAKHDLLRKTNLNMFDMIETINSVDIAREINQKCEQIDISMPVLIEINSGEEEQKSGILSNKLIDVIKRIAEFDNLEIMGLMTMGSTPHQSMQAKEDRKRARKCFQKTKELFDDIKKMQLSNVKMEYLSMGMSNSYKIALKEGANMVRIGSKIYGTRN